MLRADLNSADVEVIAMRTLLAVLGIALFTAAAARTAGVAIPASAAVQLSSSRAGARPVVLTLRLRYEMQCARPGPGPLVITFPAGERLPAQIAAGDVLVDDGPAAGVRRSGQTVSVGLPIRHGPLCDVIAPSVLVVVFDRGAQLGNPSRPGHYAIDAQTPRVSARTSIAIR
jgi:hypothetical protein